MDCIDEDESQEIVWRCKRILGHQGPPQPTHPDHKELMADFFTKPLQGKLFHHLRTLVMNHRDNCPTATEPWPSGTTSHRSVLEDGGDPACWNEGIKCRIG